MIVVLEYWIVNPESLFFLYIYDFNSKDCSIILEESFMKSIDELSRLAT